MSSKVWDEITYPPQTSNIAMVQLLMDKKFKNG